MTFITRFAPSPTGPLHLGHAYSALLAYDMAQAAGGIFHLRIDDIDQSRARPEWQAQIYDDLAWLGLTWPPPCAANPIICPPIATRCIIFGCADCSIPAPAPGATSKKPPTPPHKKAQRPSAPPMGASIPAPAAPRASAARPFARQRPAP